MVARTSPHLKGLVAVVLVAAGLSAVPTAPAAAQSPVTITTVANRADLISGPTTLVRIDLPAGTDPRTVSIDLNGHPVDDRFAPRPNGLVEGLLTDLTPGSDVVTARLADGSGARLVITDHPIGGPVFAGPQVQPWFCANQANGAGPATDAQCDTDPTYSYQYKSSVTGQFAAYDPADPPPDVATTTTDQGVTVPYVVRIETGVIDRGVYQIAVLDTPGAPWAPWAPQPAWNGKLFYQFGGDCTPDHNQGPAGLSTLLNDASLSRGFLNAYSGNTVLGQDCNSVVAAETLMMVKEHIVDSYGPIRYTMGAGCSGGSMQQQWDVSDYPGLLDGIIPSCSFPDIWETVQEAEDCHLLDTAFAGSPLEWALLTQQDSVTGYAAPTTCALWDNGVSGYARTWLDPAYGPGCVGGGQQPSPSWAYDPKTNPTGVRCTLQDYMAAVFGQRASDGFANRPFDNVGVQYGLKALTSGQITPQQFADLNAKVGGLDIDWNWQAQRSSADPAALSVAYRAGLVTYPAAAASVPIIDVRGAGDVEIHTDVHSYTMRARLDAANGNHDNQVIWTAPGVQLIVPQAVTDEAFTTMDRWLTAVENDHRSVARSVKVAQDKPAVAVDSCWINSLQVTDETLCHTVFPYFATPRIAAGGPLADNSLKCRLKPLDPADYPVTFTSAQWAELQQAFPTGVCDYSRPAVDQQPSVPWITFAGGPGGQPLGPPPVSTALSAT